MVGIAIDALGGGVGACAIDILWHSRLYEAFDAGMSSSYVCGVATYAAAFGTGLT